MLSTSKVPDSLGSSEKLFFCDEKIGGSPAQQVFLSRQGQMRRFRGRTALCRLSMVFAKTKESSRSCQSCPAYEALGNYEAIGPRCLRLAASRPECQERRNRANNQASFCQRWGNV